MFGFEIGTAAPALSTLVQVFRGVESEVLFLERNSTRVAELKHQAARVRHSTINRWALHEKPPPHLEGDGGANRGWREGSRCDHKLMSLAMACR